MNMVRSVRKWWQLRKGYQYIPEAEYADRSSSTLTNTTITTVLPPIEGDVDDMDNRTTTTTTTNRWQDNQLVRGLGGLILAFLLFLVLCWLISALAPWIRDKWNDTGKAFGSSFVSQPQAVNKTGSVADSTFTPTAGNLSSRTSGTVGSESIGGDPTGTDWAAQKCAWLKHNFPQTTEGVQQLGASLAKVNVKRIRTHLFRCTTADTAYDGFIVLGPNEGYGGNVTMTVPSHGAIDAYLEAKFSGTHTSLGPDTERALNGTVTGLSMTYWPYLDEDPPTSGSSSTDSTHTMNSTESTDSSKTPTSTNTGSSDCMSVDTLVTQKGWKYYPSKEKQAESVTRYKGAVVKANVQKQDLPEGWEVLTDGSGVSTIYPPKACQ